LRVQGSALPFLHRFASATAALMFAAVFTTFMLKVVLRYAASIQLAWADEVCSILFVWIIFWANAFLVPDSQQIAFDLVVRTLPPRGRRVAAILRNLILGGLFAAALPGSIGYILFLWREHTPVLQLRLDFVYACFGFFLIAVCVRAAVSLWQLLRPAPAG
jgi:TRAP-type C4-dicarboxylate transport system permease small subunit